MAQIFQDWLVRNSGRIYPLDDAATGYGDAGNPLPESAIVDMNLWVPHYEFDGGRKLEYCYVSSVIKTESILSITVLGTAGHVYPAAGDPVAQPETPFTPICTLSVTRPFTPYRNYAVTPMLPGVGGWIMLGDVNDGEDFVIHMSTPEQGLLAPKAVRWYTPLPIPEVGLKDGVITIDGDVILDDSGNISIEKKLRTIEGEAEPREVIEFSMPTDELSRFSGPCGGRPESGTCNRTPITSLSGVEADCSGNIDLNITGLEVNTITDGNGICIDSDISLTQACAEAEVEINLGPSCSLEPPFASDFNTNDGEFRFDSGYWFTDSGLLYGGSGAGFTSGAAGTCITTLDDDASRTFAATIDDLNGATAGMFFSDNGLTRIVALQGDGNLYSEDLFTNVLTPIGSISPPGMSMSITVTDQNIGGVAIPDNLWNASGATGLVVRDLATVIFSAYSVS